ncbi:hypothetical protein [Arthrobacter sp. GMC3]|uniref:hypothetical protein n=1 Tax=Arthrobacter sp. GMC3 TaxID=2058894 RepID=UPI000CE53815|nr:hypothetical protein [Arthrobacter sp. GMC3]
MAHEYSIPKLHLGRLVTGWIQSHCVIPEGDKAGEPFVPTVDHAVYLANFYEVRPHAKVGELNVAFTHRAGLWMAAQKVGKSPGIATQSLVEFVGPSLFAGWAKAGDMFKCIDHGCPCGWVYWYTPGEPMGRPRPTPRIQIAAVVEDQVENTWGALVPMIDNGPLANILRTGEAFIKHPNKNRDSRIETVTSKADGRLGARISAAFPDEIGLWTDSNKMKKFYRTLSRGLAGMGGRMSCSTNCYDPAEQSQAQSLHESRQKDIYKHYFPPPATLDFKLKADRKKIFAFNYKHSPWVDIRSIEAEATALMEENPGEAERFFGNRIVAGSQSWLKVGQWEKKFATTSVRPRTKVCGGFDGSETNDLSGIRLETLDFHQFTPTYHRGERSTIWDPREWNGRVPRNEVHAAWADLNNQYEFVRVYCDPFKFETELDEWKALYGEKIFFEWRTNRVSQMHASLEGFKTSIVEPDSKFSHDACETTAIHMRNAVERARPGQKYILGKASELQKIDLAMSSTLAHEATGDAVASGANNNADAYAYVF